MLNNTITKKKKPKPIRYIPIKESKYIKVIMVLPKDIILEIARQGRAK